MHSDSETQRRFSGGTVSQPAATRSSRPSAIEQPKVTAKVIHVVLGKANPNRMSGVNKVVHSLATSQVEKGLATEVWGITGDRSASTPSRTYRLRLFQSRRLRLLLAPPLLDAVKLTDRGQVFHLHGGLIPEFWALTRHLERLGKKWVLTPHGCYSKHALSRGRLRKLLYIRVFERRLLEGAQRIHVLALAELKDLATLASRQKCVVIPNGEIPRLAISRGETRPAKKPLLYGYCGRLDAAHKGLDILLSGFLRYQQRGGKARLTIAGDGPDRARLAKLASSPVARAAVEFTGPKFGHGKERWIREIDVFVQTSRFEGMPMGVLEAAAYGLPLLISQGTNLGGPVTKWGAGVVLAKNDAEHVAEAIQRLDQAALQGHLSQIADNSLRMIEVDFSWDRIVDRMYEHLYLIRREQPSEGSPPETSLSNANAQRGFTQYGDTEEQGPTE